MTLVSGYDNEIFISYSHIDNQPFGDPRGGWVDIFHQQLQNFVDVHVGRRTKLWRDKRLTGVEVFSTEIEQQLQSSAVLVSIISPGYLQSEWCNRELVAFARTAQDRGSLLIGNLKRVVKAFRLPVEANVLPGLLDDVLGQQFYRVDPMSGRARDLLLDPATDAVQVFRAKVDDLAHDLSRLLTAMAAPQPIDAVATGETVFLAWTTADLADERERLRRELEARRYRVVPTGNPPLNAADLRERIGASMRDAKVAIHLVGGSYGFVPEGEDRSVIELQADHALCDAESTTAHIFWLAPSGQARDTRLTGFVGRLHQHAPNRGRLDVLANKTTEDLKTLVIDRLNQAPTTVPRPASRLPLVYVLCDPLDRELVAPIIDSLFTSVEVRLPLFEGTAEQIRDEHYETLKECAGVLVFWGKGSEAWLRTILRDINRVFGMGRKPPFKATTLYVTAFPDARKESFRTHEHPIVHQKAEFQLELVRPFMDALLRQ